MRILDEKVSQITVPTPFAVGDTHVYLIKGETLSLVDAGVKTKEAFEAIKFQLKQLGYFPNDIEQLILTHHHPDHIGLIDQFPRAKSVIAHQDVDGWIRRDEPFLQYYEQFFKEYFIACGVPDRFDYVIQNLRDPLHYAGEGALTEVLSEGDIIPGHDNWQVIETKGHAQSHLSFLRKHDGLFIGGDHVLHHISSNPLLEPPFSKGEARPKPLLQYRANLRKCLTLGIRTVLPGHGPIFSNIDELIPLRLKKQEERADKVLLLLKEKALTPFQVCQQLFKKHYEKQLELTMSETIGQLDFLEEQNKVEQYYDDGVLFYRSLEGL